MTNPANAMRILVTYAICIPLAIFMGFTMTEIGDNPDYSNLFVVGIVVAVLASPIFIKWHYPIMIFGLGCPMVCFFLKGRPPLWEVVVILSVLIAIVERAINSERRFIKAPVIVWPLLYTAAMAYFTAEMTGGIGLHSLGGDVGGGQKYIAVFAGIAMFFALTSRPIPKEKRNLYLILLYLSGLPAFLSDMFPFLPAPLNYINLFFPPSSAVRDSGDITFGVSRLGACATTAGVVVNFLIVKYGLRGIFSALHPGRFFLFCLMFVLTMLGGFRLNLIFYCEIFLLLFFLEGLYRTRMSLVFVAGILLGTSVLVPFADKLPFTFQRALSFLPLNLDPAAKLDAEGSKEWRENMWAATWPKVPQYLLLGKGYALRAEDFEVMGGGDFAGLRNLDAGDGGLATSMDYHNGPLSTLMPFGIWGMISYLWVGVATLFILYRNYRYGDADLKTLNTFLLASGITSVVGFFFLFGAYSADVGNWAKLAGVSLAFNWGIQKATAPRPAAKPVIRRLPSRAGQPKILPA
jgi:hypothetical protein